jgi:hypothetical protein
VQFSNSEHHRAASFSFFIERPFSFSVTLAGKLAVSWSVTVVVVTLRHRVLSSVADLSIERLREGSASHSIAREFV